MPHVTVLIDGKQFRLACEEGQEAHLSGLAESLDQRIKSLRGSFGEIGDLRLAIMAGLMLGDELVEEKRKGSVGMADVSAGRAALMAERAELAGRDHEIAGMIDTLSERLERITRSLSGQDQETR